MRVSNNLPIMPKEPKSHTSLHTASIAPYPTSTTPALRSAAIWNAADDETLITARASGLNWQPIASKHFPSKTANACRKRHERLVERRQIEDWDAEKLELLAREYNDARKEMWELLASRMGEKWTVVETKCMERGLKNLLAMARTSNRKGTMEAQNGSFDDERDQGIPVDRNSDSGIGFGSDAEMELDDRVSHSRHTASSSWHATTSTHLTQHQEHSRSRSLPQSLPLYQPPPPLNTALRRTFDGPMTTSPAVLSYPGRPAEFQRYSPDFQNGRGGISIQSVLSPADPLR